jgi:uncharacterized protein
VDPWRLVDSGRAITASHNAFRRRAATIDPVATSVILWQRLDEPGFEWCSVRPLGGGRMLEGVALVALEGVPWRVDYTIELDEGGRTRRASIRASGGDDHVIRNQPLELEANGAGTWRRNDAVIIDSPDCLDIDLGFSPVTNSLPIWRLGLAPGGRRDIRVAWVLLPSLEVVEGRQTYERLGETQWRYRSAGFEADLTVGEDGLVDDYAGYWRAIARGVGRAPRSSGQSSVIQTT